MTNMKSVTRLVAFATAFAFAAVTAPAFAAVTCSPSAVNTDSGAKITVLCGGVWYFAQPGVCGNRADSIKAFLNVAEAAILSGKSLDIGTNTASECSNHLVFMQMNK
jgi:hypothetical protein